MSHQSPAFKDEFPSLTPEEKVKERMRDEDTKDMQYGPGPSLRPQNVGSWREGGGCALQPQEHPVIEAGGALQPSTAQNVQTETQHCGPQTAHGIGSSGGTEQTPSLHMPHHPGSGPGQGMSQGMGMGMHMGIPIYRGMPFVSSLLAHHRMLAFDVCTWYFRTIL